MGVGFGDIGEGVGDVFAFDEEFSVELDDLLLGAAAGGSDAGVRNFLTLDGLAFARGDAGVLDVEIVFALGFGGILIGGHAGHYGVCIGGLGSRGGLLGPEAKIETGYR